MSRTMPLIVAPEMELRSASNVPVSDKRAKYFAPLVVVLATIIFCGFVFWIPRA